MVKIYANAMARLNNLMPIENLPSKKYLDRLPSLNDIDLFSLNADNVNNSDLEYSSIRNE